MNNSILIIDEDRLFCDALARLVATTAFKIAAVCPDVNVAMARIASDARPDIVLADLASVRLEDLRRLSDEVPGTRLGLFGDPDPDEARQLMRLVGPRAILGKGLAKAAMIAALELLALDVCLIPRGLVEALPPPSARPVPMDEAVSVTASGALTGRERDILRHLAAGDGNRRIADRLGITESTVKMHCKSLLRKLGVPNRTQAALWAHRVGLAAETGGAAGRNTSEGW